MGIQKTFPQKSYKLAVGVRRFTGDFIAANRKFNWLETVRDILVSQKNQDATIGKQF